MCREQSKSYARAGKTFFAIQAPTYFIISYVSKNVYSSHAKSMLTFSKHRSRDALRAGLVAIRSRQRVSERRAVGLKRSIHTRPENILGASKDELISSKALGKTPLVATIGAAHSFSHRQTLGRWAKISAKNATDRQIYSPTLYLEDTTASFKARTIFPEISRIFT